ncbi:hypothetical protein PIIN_11491 [Serendipita indica DSM 11827]|uniref:Glucose-methanol-choline oxidoreductase C-terminal domain-containing protein n=1 Tax=Serendipita indica (strain DSM 11827) TaxID=1109443 RepID=G4U1S1_SERID|nr:hypothetical protein PIIN_11491 [Serendipita indica DSM 11827]
MAPKNLNGVVDSSLKVWGTANVRVVDASIVPQHIAAHMQSTVYAIGNKAGAIILSGSSTGNTNDAVRGRLGGVGLSGAIAIFAGLEGYQYSVN